jgi:dihydroxyacetone kinase-like protein
MDRGFRAVVEKLDGVEDTPPGKLLTTAGSTLVSKVGGASGPHWGTALRRAGRTLGDADEFDGDALVEALAAALAGVQELGQAEPGDKTMVDSFTPALEELRNAREAGASLEDALGRAADAAKAGAEATVPLLARKGRASYLGERSIGHQDPGATSTALILAALQRAVAAG